MKPLSPLRTLIFLGLLTTVYSLRVLLFTKTAGYRHGSIPVAVAALTQAGTLNNWTTVVHTEDAGYFTGSSLENFDVVVFLLTSGDILTAEQQLAFEAYVRGGGGYAGVHSASDTEYDWPFYGEKLACTHFSGHPAIQEATIHLEGPHPLTEGLPDPWVRTDEWYNFVRNPRPNVTVLGVLDEGTYDGGTMGADHPIFWAREESADVRGRSFYTALGHTSESYGETAFVTSLARGIEWAGKLEDLTPETPGVVVDGEDSSGRALPFSAAILVVAVAVHL